MKIKIKKQKTETNVVVYRVSIKRFFFYTKIKDFAIFNDAREFVSSNLITDWESREIVLKK